MSTPNLNGPGPLPYAATHPLVPVLPEVSVAAPTGGMSGVIKIVVLVAVVFFAVCVAAYIRVRAKRKAAEQAVIAKNITDLKQAMWVFENIGEEKEAKRSSFLDKTTSTKQLEEELKEFVGELRFIDPSKDDQIAESIRVLTNPAWSKLNQQQQKQIIEQAEESARIDQKREDLKADTLVTRIKAITGALEARATKLQSADQCLQTYKQAFPHGASSEQILDYEKRKKVDIEALNASEPNDIFADEVMAFKEKYCEEVFQGDRDALDKMYQEYLRLIGVVNERLKWKEVRATFFVGK